VWATLVCVLLTLASCVDITGERYAREQEAKARREPYYGTGVVAQVIRPDVVWVTFTPPPLLLPSARLIIVRNNTVVAKVEFNGGAVNETYLCHVLEGTPEVGDLVLGRQREAQFTPRAPPSPTRELP
jgi:hypothetical protein